jgi:transposase-like protein
MVPHDANATLQKTFQTKYANKGVLPQTKLLIVKMATNGSGIRDTARVLDISSNTVLKVLKKQKSPNKHKSQIHQPHHTVHHTSRNG